MFPPNYEAVLKSFNSINLYWSYPEDRERKIEDKLYKPLCVAYPSKDARHSTNRSYNSQPNFEFFE